MRSDYETMVEIPAWAAREAYQELDMLIERTGGGETGAAEANTPLAEVRQRTREHADAQEKLDEFTVGSVLGLIDKVARERNVDVSGADPLVDRTFQARDAFDSALLEAMDGKTVPTSFGQDYVDPIHEGEKTKTIRHDFAPVDPGDTLVMVDEETGQTFARAPVQSVWGMTARTLVHPEVTVLKGGHRDYDDVHELLGHLYEFYPADELGPETQLTIVEWGDIEEVDG